VRESCLAIGKKKLNFFFLIFFGRNEKKGGRWLPNTPAILSHQISLIDSLVCMSEEVNFFPNMFAVWGSQHF
jgi:hypothetical protein